jgi:hypothetical protein
MNAQQQEQQLMDILTDKQLKEFASRASVYDAVGAMCEQMIN